VRKLATAAAVSLALASGGVFGLGLGDIEMRSALNQPMNAEIRLTAVKPGDLDGMIVQLASQDAFARAGIERSQEVIDLKFSVDSSSGAPVIRISSRRPIVEPFLNFLLEVEWSQGRMVREYTVLLDPPVFMTPSATQRNEAADTPAIVQSGDDALVVPTPIQRDNLQADAESALDGGELIDLDELSDVELLGNSSATVVPGDIVSLTDLTQPNTEADAQRVADDLENIQVALESDVEEVSDDYFVRDAGTTVRQSSDARGGEIITLDELDISNDGAPVTSANIASASAGESTVIPLEELDLDRGPRTNQNGDGVDVLPGDTLFENDDGIIGCQRIFVHRSKY